MYEKGEGLAFRPAPSPKNAPVARQDFVPILAKTWSSLASTAGFFLNMRAATTKPATKPPAISIRWIMATVRTTESPHMTKFAVTV